MGWVEDSREIRNRRERVIVLQMRKCYDIWSVELEYHGKS